MASSIISQVDRQIAERLRDRVARLDEAIALLQEIRDESSEILAEVI